MQALQGSQDVCRLEEVRKVPSSELCVSRYYRQACGHLLTMMLERVPFGDRMTISAIGMYMPDIQPYVVFLIGIVMLGPCVFAAS
jgi:hypothetical protein